MRICFVLFLIGLAVTPAETQTSNRDILCGTVRDVQGASLPNVKIKVSKKGNNKIYLRSADNEGNFNLMLAPAKYQVTFRIDGFKTRTLKNVSIPSPCFDIELKSAVRPHNII